MSERTVETKGVLPLTSMDAAILRRVADSTGERALISIAASIDALLASNDERDGIE